jgi:uncharacterized protein DUF4169
MSGAVNLRQARKRKVHEAAAKTAAENRAKSGQSCARQEAAGKLRTVEGRRLNGHLREALGTDEGRE